MARKISLSQFKSKIRQAQQKQKQAINRYNQEARRHNQKAKQAVNKFNQEVRAYNARVRANRQKIKNELDRLSRQPSVTITTQYTVYRTSVETLHNSYTRLESYAEAHNLDPVYNPILDLAERETANSLEVTNKILGDDQPNEEPEENLVNAELLNELREISPDLDDRWNGAVFALNPKNPDAARHFCTSSREIITQIIEIKAPDSDVFALMPDCPKTERGNPTRRSKIRYFLNRKGMLTETLEDFVENDLENIIELFQVFNDATHGSAGKFGLAQLKSIKKRVEHGIKFLTEII